MDEEDGVFTRTDPPPPLCSPVDTGETEQNEIGKNIGKNLAGGQQNTYEANAYAAAEALLGAVQTNKEEETEVFLSRMDANPAGVSDKATLRRDRREVTAVWRLFEGLSPSKWKGPEASVNLARPRNPRGRRGWRRADSVRSGTSLRDGE